MNRSADFVWRAAAISPVAAALNFVALAFISFEVIASHHTGVAGRHLAVSLLLVAAIGGWAVWTVGRAWTLPAAVVPVSLVVLAGAGAALTGFVATAMVLPAVAALGATLAFPGRQAAVIVLVAAVALSVSAPVGGQGLGTGLGAAAAVLGGSVMGLSRRSSLERQAQEANIRIVEARTEAERARAELLAGRNHLARELHDVLAHTLSALSLQLEALDSLMPDGPPNPEVEAQLAEIRRLVHDGLDEARGAVAALREDLPPLDERLRKLCAERGVTPVIAGQLRPLPADVSLALYRVAQEAMTNVMRHAPGVHPEVELGFGADEVVLVVANRAPAAGAAGAGGAAASPGGGYGLQGIRERVLLLGGSVEAGPAGGGWRLEARVPAPG